MPASVTYKKSSPEVNCFLFALCKGACFSELRKRAAVFRQALCVCVCVKVLLSCSRVSWRSASYPGVTCVGENAGLFSGVCYLCFWRALGQSVQAQV